MDETRRFIRYVMPGLVFIIETILGLWLVLPQWTVSQITPFFSEKNGLGVAVTGILASGALGYIFATVHHWFHWYSPTDQKVFDNSNTAEAIVRIHQSTKFSNEWTDRMTALQITSAYWFKMKARDTPIGNADEFLESFSDLSHGAGAARVASFVALSTVVFTCAAVGSRSSEFWDVFRWTAMIFIGSILVLLFDNGYRRLSTIQQGIFDRVAEEELAALAKEAESK